ncbi:protoporphyrinogen oxidase HemJ [Helicobacter pametensis]|uniref:protoporphyrinogen oxidase HemJ n=1 Tax=Helicobacter pametensis TaxID=95149 RepID=UPI0004846D9E|nr:protoporphyrinogen oxidase HemJ [Helicobacter pametensis]
MEAYQWLKVLHILAFTSWMAMLFYIPRLFVYHAEHIHNAGFNDVVKIQESKLYYFIGWPAMIATLGSGLGLIWIMGGGEYLRSAAWMHIKLTFVILLVAYHFLCGMFMKQFAKGVCKLSGKFFRIFNEIPTLILIAIVYLVVFQPALWVK